MRGSLLSTVAVELGSLVFQEDRIVIRAVRLARQRNIAAHLQPAPAHGEHCCGGLQRGEVVLVDHPELPSV